jgi:hypothetical protein
MKVLTSLIFTSALSFGGYSLWNKELPAPAQPVAAIELAVAAVKTPAAVETSASAELPVVANTEVEKSAAVEFESADLISGVEQGTIQATLRGNGRDNVAAKLRNNSPTPLRVHIPAGQILESGRNAVLVLRSVDTELMPAESRDFGITTVAIRSTNKVGNTAYKPSYQNAPRIETFLTWIGEHPEISTPAAQTAILALSENLPLSAFAKFAPTNGTALKSDTDSFRVETADILAALTALRTSGVKIEGLVLGSDPQLRIESMIEPLSRESAKRFYGIREEREWDFWKTELLSGDQGTRHYALFGIARFYPEIALDMLPKWAREAKTHPVYRMAAVQALADTQRAEALPVLRQLSADLGTETDLGKAATHAANYLDQRLNQLAMQTPVLAFRGKNSVSAF